MRHGSLLAFALTTTLLAPSAVAEEASPTGKGIVGGALLGGEAVLLVEAALGVQPLWAYAVGGGAGAVAGGVGGYFLEQGGDAKLSMYLLAGGMALVIPTWVAVASATAFTPPVDYVEDQPPADEPVAEPARVSRRKKSTTARRARPALPPPALVGLEGGRLTLSVPAVEVRERFTRREVAVFGVRQRTELRVPVVNVAF